MPTVIWAGLILVMLNLVFLVRSIDYITTMKVLNPAIASGFLFWRFRKGELLKSTQTLMWLYFAVWFIIVFWGEFTDSYLPSLDVGIIFLALPWIVISIPVLLAILFLPSLHRSSIASNNKEVTLVIVGFIAGVIGFFALYGFRSLLYMSVFYFIHLTNSQFISALLPFVIHIIFFSLLMIRFRKFAWGYITGAAIMTLLVVATPYIWYLVAPNCC